GLSTRSCTSVWFTWVSSIWLYNGFETVSSFTIPILTNGSADDGENFTITLTSPTNAGLSSPSTAHFTIFVDGDGDADLITDLNELSDAIDSRLTTGVQDTGTTTHSIDGLITEINGILGDMATARTQNPPNWTGLNGYRDK